MTRDAASSPRLSPAAVDERLRAIFSRTVVSLEIVSGRVSRWFSPGIHDSMTRHFAPRGVAVTLRPLAGAAASGADIVLLLSHVHKEEAGYLAALRESGFGGVAVAWLWDNHHAKDANRQVGGLADVTIASHDCYAGYLAGCSTLARSVMLCSTQWTSEEARAYWIAPGMASGTAERRDDLYGGFVRYKGTARTACLDAMIASGRYPALRLLDGHAPSGYAGLTEEARFREWSAFAVSLCLPYRSDLSNRFFDAWLTGQVPVVSPDIEELTSPWAAPHLDRHFVRAASYEWPDIDAAHRRALALFRSGGPAGIDARHRMVLDGHLFQHRVGTILDLMRAAAEHGVQAVLRP